MRYLRTNTATRITVGPFLDKTDGITPEVALTVTACKLTLMVDTGGVPTLVLDVAPTASGGANDMVHVTGDDSGYYDLELAAANVNYLGRACLSINDVAVHCPVFHEFEILPASIYDMLHETTGPIAELGILERGTLQSATGTTAVLRAATSLADDLILGATLHITSGTGAGQARLITDWVSSTDTATVDTWTTTPDSTSVYVVFASPPSSATSLPSVNAVQVSGDATAADNLEAMFDGTGYVGGSIKLGVDAVAISGDSVAADELEAMFEATIAEIAAVPAANAKMIDKLRWMFLQSRNKITQTATTQLVKADDGTTTVGTSTVSDDGTTFTRGEFV